MNDNSEIKLTIQKYETGTVFNLNKINFNWKELKQFVELEELLKT